MKYFFKTQYLVGAALVLFSLYQVRRNEYWEYAMYCCTGLAFIVMGLIKDKVLIRYGTLLNVLSWILITLSALLFLFLVRTDI